MTKKFDWDKSSKRPQPLTLQDEHALIIRREQDRAAIKCRRETKFKYKPTNYEKSVSRRPGKKAQLRARNRKVKQSDFCARTRIGLVGLTLKADDYKPEFTLIKRRTLLLKKPKPGPNPDFAPPEISENDESKMSKKIPKYPCRQFTPKECAAVQRDLKSSRPFRYSICRI